MKTRLLKQLRKESWSQIEVRNANLWNYKWVIGTGPHTFKDKSFETRDEAIAYAKSLWHELATEYLWRHREWRRRNAYPY